jgi:AcrR family transcriptional regulator
MARMGRDERILEAAEQLIYERGFDGVGVDAIGQLAGLSGSAIYRHFDGKDEILGVLFDKAIDALLIRIQAADPDPQAELRALVQAHVEFAGSHPRLAAIWLREERSLADPYRRGYRRRQQRYVDRWRDCLGRCFPEASAERITSAMRAVHALMLSDATRRPGGHRAGDTDVLLIDMALRSLQALATTTDGDSPALRPSNGRP